MRTLRERFRDDRLGLTASSLTFTTLISLVPLLTVMLAVFTAFPMFSAFQAGLEKYFLQTLVPPNIAKPVLGALTLFASKASRLGAVGLIALGFTAMALMLTIDRTLNSIWRVRKPRPIGQRVLVYWATVTLGPVLLGASLTLTSYAISASSGLVQQLPGGVAFTLNVAEFFALASAIGALYYFVPHAPVAKRHAAAGGCSPRRLRDRETGARLVPEARARVLERLRERSRQCRSSCSGSTSAGSSCCSAP
jgi:membrane protein